MNSLNIMAVNNQPENTDKAIENAKVENINSNWKLPITLEPNISVIENISRLALQEKFTIQNTELTNVSIVNELNHELTDTEKQQIKEETEWSDKIIDSIHNMKQYEVLKNAGLTEEEINGRPCLIKKDFDLDYKDEDGISNREKIARGLSPIDSKTGSRLELHHLGQKIDSPLVELTVEEHRTGEYEDGKKNQSLWHDNSRPTEVHTKESTWSQDSKAHWKDRSHQHLGV